MVEIVLAVDLCGVRACAKCGTADRTKSRHCKSCKATNQREYRQANTEKFAAYDREYYLANTEKAVAYRRKYHLAKVAKKAALEANNEP